MGGGEEERMEEDLEKLDLFSKYTFSNIPIRKVLNGVDDIKNPLVIIFV